MDALSRLALAAGKGDQRALTELIRTTQSDVWRLCAHLVDPGAADDLTQETYLRAVRHLRKFRGDGPFRSWLLTIARRACAAEIASRQRRRDAALDFGATMPSHHSDHALQVELGMLLDTLEPERRAAFVLTQILGCTYEETATICGCPIGTVRSRVARARDTLIELTREGMPGRTQARSGGASG